MGYLDRAKSMHGRGNAVRASVILAEGLKRNPSNAEALEWLLHLYVEELDNPGLERELLQILGAQPNGHDLLQIVQAELEEVGRWEKLEALRKVHSREGLAVAPAASDGASEAAASTADAPEPRTAVASGSAPAEHWEAFESPLRDGRPDSGGRRASPAKTPAGPSPLGADLGTLDTLPPELRAEYGVETPPALRSASRPIGAWIAIALAGALVLIALGWYALRGRSLDSDPMPATWESAESEEQADPGVVAGSGEGANVSDEGSR